MRVGLYLINLLLLEESQQQLKWQNYAMPVGRQYHQMGGFIYWFSGIFYVIGIIVLNFLYFEYHQMHKMRLLFCLQKEQYQ
jgi:hypothetical protein